MDQTELTNKLQPFIAACEKQGYPLKDLCLEEAYPGVASSSFIVKVVALWVDDLGSCSEALDILLAILWETVNEQTRRHIFALYILDDQDLLHCISPSLVEHAEAAAVS